MSISAFGEAFHDRVNLVLRQNKVAHNHCVIAACRLECEPRAERQRRLDLDSVERDFQI